jgi:hypothetical protein
LQQRGAQVGPIDNGDMCLREACCAAVLDEMKLYYKELPETMYQRCCSG